MARTAPRYHRVMNPQDIIRKRSGQFIQTAVDDEIVLIDIEGGELLSLEGTGQEIWNALAEPSSLYAHLDRLMRASATVRPGQVASAAITAPVLAAAKAGHDWLLDAGLGNNTISNDGRWAYVEYARTGQWGELYRLLRRHPGDNWPIWRRLLARSELPQLPAKLRRSIRAARHQSLLRVKWFRTRREWLAWFWQNADQGREMEHTSREVLGMRQHDVTAYRPLIKFCAGLPTRQFVRSGTVRYLARRMGAGRLPEAQRTNTNYGLHKVDWFRSGCRN